MAYLFSNRALFTLKESRYLNLVMILAPLINFLSGVSIDLYAPSMPALALYFHTSQAVIQGTIAISLLGLGIGCLICGILFDSYGRRKIILIALLIFLITSLLALHCHTIHELMLVRFIQGLMTAAMSVGARTLIADHFTGHRFVVGVIYASFAYGSGPVIAPYIGGYLQYHFGWQANFDAYAVISGLMLLTTLCFVHERFQAHANFKVKEIVAAYHMILSHRYFLAGATILGLIFLEQLFYSTIGPFLVQHHLGYNAVFYGKTSLLVGLSYLVSTLLNRFLIRFFKPRQLVLTGFTIILLALATQFLFALFFPLSVWVVVAPLCGFIFSLGFIYPNVIAICLRLFPSHVGTTGALQVFLSVMTATLGVLIISQFTIISLFAIFIACTLMAALQFILYLGFQKTLL